jgi:cytosine/adenosine deaminase-related metal-dependent hydrolase
MKESAKMARKYKLRLHTHLVETKHENEFCVKVYGRRPLKLMEECDGVGDDVFYAHGIYFNDEELKILSD